MSQDALVLSTREVDLDTIFAEAVEGWKISITRKDPMFCDGHLGTFDYDPNDPISMDWIREQFGGRKLQVRVLDADNKYITHRTLKFPDPPKAEGEELVQGPGGMAVKKSELETRKNNNSPAEHTAAPPVIQPQNTDLMTTLLTKLMDQQAKQASDLQAQLFDRIKHLESMMKQNQNHNPAPVQVAAANPLDPLAQMQNTLQVVEQLEAFRKAISPAEQSEPSIYEKMMEKFIDLEMKKRERDIERQSAALRTGAPPLPQPGNGNGSHRPISDGELAAMVKDRLDGMDPRQKAALLGNVLGEDFEFEEYDEEEEDNENAPRQENIEDLKSSPELLTAEDRASLGDDIRHTDSRSPIS